MVLGQTQREFVKTAEPAFSLKSPLRYLKGVGPERSRVLDSLELCFLEDLFYYFPRRYEDRSRVKRFSELVPEQKQCTEGVVSEAKLVRLKGGRAVFRTTLSDGKRTLDLLFYGQPYLSNIFSAKAQVSVCGTPQWEGKKLVMIHPEYEIVKVVEGETQPESAHFKRVIPIYPLTEDLSQKSIRSLIFRTTGEHASLFKDALTTAIQNRYKLTPKDRAIRQIHFPDNFQELKKAYTRLVFEEFFLMQTLIQFKRKKMQTLNSGLSHTSGEETLKKFIQSLPFALTKGQELALSEILDDMKKPQRMNRLVQGDVGSGKTVIAAAALLFSALNGFQGALMAPTEVLANQHYFNLCRLLEPFGLKLAYLGQGISAEEKNMVLKEVASGSVHILIGTHALIQDGVQFKKSGLVVVDEQHKFGVLQRTALQNKAMGGAHLLLMTATPIPRSLAMTLYGDLDVSIIAERPAGRAAIKTLWVDDKRRADVYRFVQKELEKGHQAYVVCPLIDENSEQADRKPSETSQKSALKVHEELKGIFSSHKTALLHGRMKSAEKKKVMEAFKNKQFDILVSTVVIEVGIDVSNATLMLIENAERFGLSQLHQLRGRVGRGKDESTCILFSDTQNPETADRLRVFERTESGFEIAEADLKLRGGGDLIGSRQHGLPELRIGDFSRDFAVLRAAQKEAKALIEADPLLAKPDNKLLKLEIKARYGQNAYDSMMA